MTAPPGGPPQLGDRTDDGLRGRVVRSVAWVALEKWGVRVATLAVFIVLGRLLAPSDLGLVALGSVFVAVLSVFVDSGFSQALVQRKELDDEHASTAFWISLAIAVALAGLLFGVAPGISALVGEQALAPVLQALSVSLPLTALSGVPAAVLQRDFGFRALALRRLFGTLVGAAAGVVLAVLGAGVWALVVQVLAGSAVGVVVLWTASPWRPRLLVSRRAAKELWSFGSSVLGIELIGLANAQADKLLVGAFAGPTALGYYFVGSRVAQVLLDMLTSVTGSLSLTTFARMQDDRPRMIRTLKQFTFASACVAFPAFGLTAALAPDVIPLVFGEKWTDSAAVMQWLAPSAALTAISWFDKGLFMAAGKPRVALGLAVGQTVLGLVLLAAALPLGIVAVAASRSLRQLLFWPVRLVALRRHLGLRTWDYTRQFLAPAVAAGVPSLAVGLLQASDRAVADPLLATLALGAGGGLVYAALLVLLARGQVRQVAATVLGRRLPRRWRPATG